MAEYDPQRDRVRPEPPDLSPVDALLDGIDAASAEGPVGGPSVAAPAPTGEGPNGEVPSGEAPVAAAPIADRPASLDPEAETSDWSPTVTPSPVDPAEDRALARLGVVGAAIATMALVALIRRRLLRSRRVG